MPSPDWRAPFDEYLLINADWYWDWTYTPMYINTNGGGPLEEVFDVSGKWTSSFYSHAANRINASIQVDGASESARWWLAPSDSGGYWPDSGLCRFGISGRAYQQDWFMFSVYDAGADFVYCAGWVPSTLAGRKPSTTWFMRRGGLVPKSDPYFFTYDLNTFSVAQSIAPTRRQHYSFFPTESAQPWATSLNLGYSTA